jgi:tetratricopeptide (TPR) repeat protein
VKLLALFLLSAGADVFTEAERLYNEGRFPEAAAQYESLRAQGMTDATLYYNLGNAYFKSGRLGSAILNYERALRLAPADDDTRANLAFANELIADAPAPPALPWFVTWAAALYRALDPEACAFALSLGFLLGGGAISLLLVGRWPRWRAALLYISAGAGLLAFASGALLLAKLVAASGRQEAIVLAPRSEVRSGPGETHPQLAEIHEGLKVTLRGEREEWYQVSLPNGLTGWVSRVDIEPI